VEAQEPREKVELFPNYTFVCFRAFYIDPITDIIKPFNFYNLIFKDGLITVSNLDASPRHKNSPPVSIVSFCSF
jgi:Mg2+ and Co2+ transporter CorA